MILYIKIVEISVMCSSIKAVIFITAVIIVCVLFLCICDSFVFGYMSLDILYLIKKCAFTHLKIAQYQCFVFFVFFLNIFQHCVKSISGLHQLEKLFKINMSQNQH